ncbi:MAG: hypothetical protein ACE366_15305 [Bradymonadia bacterium]
MSDVLPQVETPLFILAMILSIILLVTVGVPYVMKLPLRRHVRLHFTPGTDLSSAMDELTDYLRGFLSQRGFEAMAHDEILVMRKGADMFRMYLRPAADHLQLSYEMEGMDSAEIESGKLSCVLGSGVSFFGLQLNEAFQGLELAQPPRWVVREDDDAATSTPVPLPARHARVVKVSPWR